MAIATMATAAGATTFLYYMLGRRLLPTTNGDENEGNNNKKKYMPCDLFACTSNVNFCVVLVVDINNKYELDATKEFVFRARTNFETPGCVKCGIYH